MAKIKYKIGKKIYEFEVSEDLANGMGDLRREAWRGRKRKTNHETLISLDEMSENGAEIPGCIEDTLEEVIARETQEEKAVLLEQLNVAISFLREEQVELVRLLDHSGLYISCNDFQDPWDSGRLGIIFYTDSTIKAEYGDEIPDDKTLLAALKREVKEYNDYLNGIWVGYTIDDPDGIVVDSCGGFLLGEGDSVLKMMKEYSDEQFYALFEKMAAQLSSKNLQSL